MTYSYYLRCVPLPFPYRVKRLDAPRMQHIASSVVDVEGARLIEEWIKQLR